MVKERLMDGVLEDKIFAPGYGEFLAAVPTEDELVTVAVADPTGDLRGPLPDELATVSNGAAKVFMAAPDREWSELRATLRRMTAAWSSYRRTNPPELLDTQLSAALDRIEAAVGTRNGAEVRQASINVAHATLDLRLQSQSPDRVDRSRTNVWRRQLVSDRAAGDSAGVAGDRAVLDAIKERFEGEDDD